jgi:hypothetical protein
MTEKERWQKDCAEMELFLVKFFIEAWVAFWWCIHASL